MFEALSILLGLVAGMLIMLLLVWAAYASRTVVFSRCALDVRPCTSADYLNDPAEAIALGHTSNLFVGNGKLYYKRALSGRGKPCHPDLDQTVHIHYPRVCSFRVRGAAHERAVMQGQGSYLLPSGRTVDALPNCVPLDPTITGSPLAEWA